jgi:hypothetical protein
MRMLGLIVLVVLGSPGIFSRADAQSSTGRGAAPSLVTPGSPTRPPDADGFIQRWLILEPIPMKGQLTDSAVQTAINTNFFPNQLTVMPRHGDKVSVGGSELTWHAVDTIGYNVNLYHFAYALEKPTSNVLFWAVTVVNSPREMRDVRLAIGSNAASVWWVNGKEVIGIYNDRQTVIDDGVSRRLTLQKGPNVLRAAIINGGGATDFCARFLDLAYRPIKDISVTLAGASNQAEHGAAARERPAVRQGSGEVSPKREAGRRKRGELFARRATGRGPGRSPTHYERRPS